MGGVVVASTARLRLHRLVAGFKRRGAELFLGMG